MLAACEMINRRVGVCADQAFTCVRVCGFLEGSVLGIPWPNWAGVASAMSQEFLACKLVLPEGGDWGASREYLTSCLGVCFGTWQWKYVAEEIKTQYGW